MLQRFKKNNLNLLKIFWFAIGNSCTVVIETLILLIVMIVISFTIEFKIFETIKENKRKYFETALQT